MDVKSSIAAIIAAKLPTPLITDTVKDVVVPGELVAKRTANSRSFDAGGGKITTHIYPCKIHTKGDDGVFRTNDPSVRRKPLGAPLPQFAYESVGAFHAHFDAVKPWNYRMELGDSRIEYEALFDESDVVDIDVETSRVGVKETITLKDKTAPTTFSWRVSKSGSSIITPPPTAEDAEGKSVPVTVSQSSDILTYSLNVKDAVFPVYLDPTSVQATNDGDVRSFHASSYTTARNAATGTNTNTSFIRIGQNTDSAYYVVFRGFASVLIPDMASLSAVSLFLYGRSDQSSADFGINLLTSTYTGSPNTADFDLFDGHQASGAYNGTVLNNTWNTTSYSATWNEFVFNAAGLAAVLAKKNDTFKMAMLSGEDYNSSAPAGAECVYFENHSSAGKEPYLSITYTPAATSVGARLIQPNIYGFTTIRAGM